MSLYTSLETSLALRDAGAPQGTGGMEWMRTMFWMRPDPGCDPYMSTPFGGAPRQARAFRADEIIEALGDRLDAIDRYGMPGATYRVALSGERGSHVADSLVEALAQAWIVVLKEEK